MPSPDSRSTTLLEGVEYGGTGSYDFGLMLRAEPSAETTVQALVYDDSSGVEVLVEAGPGKYCRYPPRCQ